MKKSWILGVVAAIVLMAGLITVFVVGVIEINGVKLPQPELSDGLRGEMGIDKNINEETLDKYLGREDIVYRDMRMLEDPANYEAIGGDAYLSGFVEGFEVVPYPLLVNVTGLPEAVGDSYTGKTLFTNKDGKYVANYDESMAFLEYYFPKDKIIFLMCGGGGYAGMTKSLLVALGWDADRIYDVGGYWYYNGAHKVEVKREMNGGVKYDFWKVSYHAPDFDEMSKIVEVAKKPVEGGELKEITAEEFNKMVSEKKEFLVMAHMAVCPAELPLTDMTKQLVRETGLVIYDLNQDEFEKTELAKTIKYLPTMVKYRDGKMLGYLDAESNDDLKYYQSVEGLKSWVEKF